VKQNKSTDAIIKAARASASMQILLTHNSQDLADVGEMYGELISRALLGGMSSPSREQQAAELRSAIEEVGLRMKIDVKKLVASTSSPSTSSQVKEALQVIFPPSDAPSPPSAASVNESVRFLSSQVDLDSSIVGRKFSTACYITDSFPSLLYLAYKYADNPAMALIANTNVGGENAHR
jgi:ADP-ribosylglycohydrolase